MTIATTTSRVVAQGNGATTAFSYNFLIPTADDVVVTFTDASGNSTELAASQYAISGLGNPAGGSVTYPLSGSPMATGQSLSVQRLLPLKQLTKLTNQGGYYPDVVEDAMDALEMQIQQLSDSFGRSLVMPPTDPLGVSGQLPSVTQRANMLLSFDSSGQPVAIAAAAQSATALQILLAGASGAAQTGFTHSIIGAAALRTLQDRERDLVHLKDMAGVDPTGAIENGSVIQAALTGTRLNGAPVNAGKVLVINSGTWKVSQGLVIGSGQRVVFEPGVTFDASGLDVNTSLFQAAAQIDFYLEGSGALLKGARATANPAIEGGSSAFLLDGAQNFEIRNFRVQDFALDGYTVTGDNTGSGPCRNGVIFNCTSTNSRRSGCSIISAVNVKVIGGEFKNSNGGTFGGPWAGIDVEPNADCFIENVQLIGVQTSGNPGGGILVAPGSMSVVGAASNTFTLKIIGGHSLNDGTLNTLDKGGLTFSIEGAMVNQIFGQVEVQGFVVDGPMDRGMVWYGWDADKAPKVIGENCIVYDPDFTLNGAGNDNRTGYVLTADASQTWLTNLGNVTLRNCRAEDRRASARMTRGFELGSSTGKTLKNILIVDPTSVNYTGAVKSDVYTDAASVAGGMLNVDVVYTSRRPVPIGSSQSIASCMGQRVLATAASNLSLPPAANCPGAHFEVETDVGINSVALLPVSGDMIGWLVDVASENLVLDNNAVISMRSRGGTSWVVESVTGKVRIAGNSTPGQVIWTTSIPTAGAHIAGDVAYNKAPAVGSPKGWRCTVSGTPGTWVSEGNL